MQNYNIVFFYNALLRIELFGATAYIVRITCRNVTKKSPSAG